MQTKPNILFLLTDQQHAGMMSCTGNPYLSTPAMDSLAAEGVRFERAYATNPVCVPSRFSLVTGRMPSEIGMFSNLTKNIDPISEHIKEHSLGHLMANAGYDALYTGKVHLPKMTIEEAGFTNLCGNSRDELVTTCVDFFKTPRTKPFFLVASLINPHDICYMALRDFAKNESEQRIMKYSSVERQTLDEALKHPEGMSEKEFFESSCPPLPPNFEPQENEPEALRILLEQRPFRMKARQEWSENRWREHRWAYARLTELVDSQIGRILDALKHSEYADNTLVVFTSDHGDMDSAHRMEHKSTIYDEVAKIPLIISPPGGTTGRVDSTHLVSNGLDLLPTFCDFAGIQPPDDIKGRSLRSVVETGSEAEWRTAVPVETAVGRAVITNRFKYCRYELGEPNEQLIDIERDPLERRNAINDEKYRDDIETLRAIHNEMFPPDSRRPNDPSWEARNG